MQDSVNGETPDAGRRTPGQVTAGLVREDGWALDGPARVTIAVGVREPIAPQQAGRLYLWAR